MGIEEYYEQSAPWNGFDRWVCRIDGFDCLKDEQIMIDHMTNQHFPPSNPYVVEGIVVADKWGREVEGFKVGGEPEVVLDTIEELEVDGVDLSALKVDDVLKLVEDGELTVEAAIEAEKDGKNRVTILRALEGEDDD